MGKRYSNDEVIKILKEYLAAMEVKEYSFFRIRAYQNAIAVINELTLNLQDLWENDRIREIPGIGPTIAQHLDSFFQTGDFPDYKTITRDLPAGMFELIGLRGIGAKKAFKLASAFELDDRKTALEKVKKAAESHQIQELEGFAEKSEQLILDSISEMKKTKNEKERMLLYAAEQISQRVIKYMEGSSYIEKIEVLGSLRRREATVGDLDIAVATDNPEAAMKKFLEFPEIEEILVEGDKKVSVNLKNDTQVDLRVINPETYGSMVQYFTGSRQHNIELRTYALRKKMSLSEYGIKHKGERKEFATDELFYEYLGLDYIPPEIRQGKNEVELAAQNKLPKLISLSDIKGDLHTHTIASDGINTLSEMAFAAQEKGYEYIGIADHAPSIQARGEKEVAEIIEKQRRNIDELNESTDIKVLFGYEVNILADATLSLPMEFLEKLDFIIAGVHTALNQDRDQMTKRLLTAIRNPFVNIIAHPTGRLLAERSCYDADWLTIFKEAKKHNKILEINSQPNRLDLPDDLVYEARKMGVKFIINTDSHDIESFDLMKYGVDVARRGWCESKEIVNTLDWESFSATFLNK